MNTPISGLLAGIDANKSVTVPERERETPAMRPFDTFTPSHTGLP
ncbi:hypothetical protein OG548_43970 [Streptomyces sp. NBC_01356]|nr:hypothetical protein [Streptomyces sp. NBC_01356]